MSGQYPGSGGGGGYNSPLGGQRGHFGAGGSQAIGGAAAGGGAGAGYPQGMVGQPNMSPAAGPMAGMGMGGGVGGPGVGAGVGGGGMNASVGAGMSPSHVQQHMMQQQMQMQQHQQQIGASASNPLGLGMAGGGGVSVPGASGGIVGAAVGLMLQQHPMGAAAAPQAAAAGAASMQQQQPIVGSGTSQSTSSASSSAAAAGGATTSAAAAASTSASAANAAGGMLSISQPNPHKEINIVALSRLGQETVQDITSRFQEIFAALKIIQPTANRDNNTEKKVQEYFRTIRLLFKRVRIIYEKCNDGYPQGMEYTHVESLVPYKNEPDHRSEPSQCEEYRKALQENQELIETVKLKNRQLREIIDRTRIIIWEINTMLSMRRS